MTSEERQAGRVIPFPKVHACDNPDMRVIFVVDVCNDPDNRYEHTVEAHEQLVMIEQCETCSFMKTKPEGIDSIASSGVAILGTAQITLFKTPSASEGATDNGKDR